MARNQSLRQIGSKVISTFFLGPHRPTLFVVGSVHWTTPSSVISSLEESLKLFGGGGGAITLHLIFSFLWLPLRILFGFNKAMLLPLSALGEREP